jgi:hypothetical protein
LRAPWKAECYGPMRFLVERTHRCTPRTGPDPIDDRLPADIRRIRRSAQGRRPPRQVRAHRRVGPQPRLRRAKYPRPVWP